jgi:hypothetical protein|tara:strand:+ start:1883 stop:2323 length:441 start_codon:yes stop_codon:yes gene_type:complete
MSIEITQVVGEDILLKYKYLKPFIESALKHSSGEWTTQQIIQGAISDPQNFHVWEVFDDGEFVAIGTTRLIQYNNFVSLHIITLGGKTNDKMTEWTEEFATQMSKFPQIDCLEFTGRRGLLKPLEKAGWKERYTTMRKSLKETFDV